MLCVVIADANNSETVDLEDIQEKPKLSTSGDRCAIWEGVGQSEWYFQRKMPTEGWLISNVP